MAGTLALGLALASAAAAPSDAPRSGPVPGLGAAWSLRPSLPSAGHDPGVFLGTASRPVAHHGATARWQDARARSEAGEPWLRRCLADDLACAGPAMLRWAALMRQAADEAPARQLRLVNRGINLLLAYRTDESLYGVEEHWASPLETLANGAGDCEDLALVKLWSLMLLGFDPEDMALLVVWDPARRQHHALLAASIGGESLALDSHHAVLLPVQAMPYRAVYAAGFAGQAVETAWAAARPSR